MVFEEFLGGGDNRELADLCSYFLKFEPGCKTLTLQH